ncbi:carbon monoxide dehydrogenase subunit G [Nakamurella sp.]|uniref:carbon monoxide dehydrogenase subunit G n=1 Tax=Nakamurella sp. TaxID=1869182 RepID=UPI00378417B8
MKVTGSSVLHAPPDQVWQAMTDPGVLAGVIPGCDGLVPLAPDRFRLTVTLGVASIKGSYTGEVSFRDMNRPRSLVMRANGSGAPGTIDTTVAVTLTELGDTTRVDYDADAIVGGMVGGVGQRVLGAVAKRTADAFFAAIDQTFTAAPEPEPVPAAAGVARSSAGGAPAVPVRSHRRDRRGAPWELAAATAVGALSMLAGVLIGVRIGRRR